MRALNLAVVTAWLIGPAVSADHWPQWRGPHGNGTSAERGLPERWSATENVAWKARLAGLGVSTPIVWGDRIFVTSQIGAGVRRPGNHPTLVQGGDPTAEGEKPLGAGRAGDPGDARTIFVVEAFHRADGRRLWEYRLPAEEPLAPVHQAHNLASPSPVTDGERVFAWFGTGQIVALDFDGTAIWTRHLGREIAPFEINWGHASSPALFGDLLILLCDHAPASYLLAVDARSGKERWRADRGKGRASYTTPIVVNGPRGPELIVNSSERVDVYDPRTGSLLWHVGGPNRFPIPVPAHHDGIVYMSRGYRSGPYMAIRPGGSGDVSDTQVLWSVPTGAPYISSLVYDAGHLYMANDVGVISAIEAKSGKRVWQDRVGGVFAASPVAGDGKIYFPSENGEVIVLRSGPSPEVIARNSVGERLVASLAISNGRIFIRSDDHLYCIGPATR
jgi:outer membrane protein assembly factor BamB